MMPGVSTHSGLSQATPLKSSITNKYSHAFEQLEPVQEETEILLGKAHKQLMHKWGL